VAYKEKAYYFGGYSGHDGTIYLDEWMELNLNSYHWRQLASSEAPQGRIDHTMCIYKDQVLLFGGRANKKVFNDLRIFSIPGEK
jgi:N-acetylneuraminic acid mutarotase